MDTITSTLREKILLHSNPLLIVSCLSLSTLWLLFKLVYYSQRNSLDRYLPGPQSSSFWYGNIRDLHADETNSLRDQWVAQYGHTFVYKGFLGGSRLYTVDLKAIQHILHHDYDYQKSEAMRYTMSGVLGNGVLVTEGDKHKSQRKVMNPAFGPAQIREFTDIFMEKSVQLRDIWMDHIEKSRDSNTTEIDALSWFSKATLDTIGIAGFNYHLDMLSEDQTNQSEFSDTLETIFQIASAMKMNILRILQAYIPAFRILPSAFDPDVKQAKATMLRIGKKLLQETRTHIQKSEVSEEKAGAAKKDLLSLLVKSNTREDVPVNQRMSDEDVIFQVPTFLVAGHETTSNALSWALFALSINPSIQSRLRTELQTLSLKISNRNPTMEELNSLTYLDAVVRETLRLYCPVVSPNRVAMKDDVIPLSRPIKDKWGIIRDSIEVKRGQSVTIPIVSVNRDRYLWGEDASEFKPERWFNPPEATSAIPGVWGNMLTFLGGARSCIGWRFAVVEMKALLFTLVQSFEYKLAVPKEDIIVKRTSIFQKPLVKSRVDGNKGRNEMPLLIKLVKNDD